MGWGVHDDVFCAGKEAVFDFLEGVLAEVVAIFPSSYLHIGGDEVRSRCLPSVSPHGHSQQLACTPWLAACMEGIKSSCPGRTELDQSARLLEALVQPCGLRNLWTQTGQVPQEQQIILPGIV